MRTATRSAALLMLALLGAVPAVEAGSPRLNRITPIGGQRGTTVELTLHGRFLENPEEVLFYEPGITVEAIEALDGDVDGNGRQVNKTSAARVRVRLKLADDCPLGSHSLRLRTLGGVTDLQRFFVGPFPTVEEDESGAKRNDKRESAKAVAANSTVNGRMNEPADVDVFSFPARRGDRLSVDVESAQIGVQRGIPDLHAAILDPDGKTLVEVDDSALFGQDPVASTIAPRDGDYFVQLRHSTYSASNEPYRLHVGTFPRPTGLYPSGGPAGADLAVRVLGDPRGEWKATVPLPDRPGILPFVAADRETHVSAPSPNPLHVSPFPNALEAEPNDAPEALTSASPADLPVAFNGIIEKAGDVDCFLFRARKGDRYKIVALAKALGSPLDATIWIKPAGGKSRGPTARAVESRPNQLGLPPIDGVCRDTLDPVIDFTAPADGEYVLGVEDDQGTGGADWVYRVECRPETDAVLAYIPSAPEDIFQPQARKVIAVPTGNRYTTQVAIYNTNRPYNGDLELVAVGLPDGVTMKAARFSPGVTRVPVVFEAAGGTKPVAKFIDLVVRPAGEGSATSLASGYRQVIPFNQYGNAQYYLHPVIDKLLVAVTEPAPFRIRVEPPKAALLQNGEIPLKFSIERAEGYDGPATVSLEWRPNGVSVATPVTIPAGKSEGEYLLGASRNASAGKYEITLTGYSGGARMSYYDEVGRTYVASQPFTLTVAEPHVDARFVRTSIERGKTAKLVCKLNHLKPFPGKAKATLARLPRGVELVGPPCEFTSDDKEIAFTLRATEDCLVGNYQGIALDATVFEDGQSLRQTSGYGMVRIDPERAPRTSSR